MNRLLGSRCVQRGLSCREAVKRRSVPRRRSFRPMLEQLETRLTPATQTFNPGDTAALIADLPAAANSPNDTTIINLQAGTAYSLTEVNNFWYGPNGLPPIASDVIIHGNGATIERASGTGPFRFIYVSGGMELTPGSLTMDNVTLEGGLAKGGDSNLGGGGLGAGRHLQPGHADANQCDAGGQSGVGRQ